MVKNKTCSILFAGNSYTFYNDLWDLFATCAASAGYCFCVDHVTCGGYHLRQYLDPADPMCEKFDQKLAGFYDFVVLQEFSTGPIMDHEGFVGSVKTIVSRLDPGTKPILYETWGRHDASPTLRELGMTGAEMTDALHEAYRRLGNELGISVSPVGIAFRKVHTEHQEIELYHPDRTHPSLAGSYLAALVLFATVTGDTPEHVSFDGRLDPDMAEIIRRTAVEVMEDDRQEAGRGEKK